MRKIIFTLIIAAALGIVVSTRMLKGISTQPTASAMQRAINKPNDPSGTIDGAKNPELIPDRVAYALLFRLISKRQTDEERKHIDSYIRQMGLGKQCKSCPKENGQGADDDRDIENLIAAADRFQQRVSVLDQQAKAIKDSNRSALNPNMMAQLAELQRQKDAMTGEIRSWLSNRLTPDGLKKVQRHINGRVKLKVKIDTASAFR